LSHDRRMRGEVQVKPGVLDQSFLDGCMLIATVVVEDHVPLLALGDLPVHSAKKFAEFGIAVAGQAQTSGTWVKVAVEVGRAILFV